MNNIYKDAVVAFSENKFDYLKLDDSVLAYNSILNSISQKEKMILLLGEAGVGKTYLLKRIYNDFKDTTLFYDIAFSRKEEFIYKLNLDLFGNKNEDSFNQVLENILSKIKHITICIDEVQLYSDSMLELFRVLSDTKKITFIFSTHLKDRDDIFSRSQFSTRISSSIVLNLASLKEVKVYIEKKLLFYGNFEVANMFSNGAYKLIYKISKGNYRKINMLLKTSFLILEEYEKQGDSIANKEYISRKIFEMAMLELEL